MALKHRLQDAEPKPKNVLFSRKLLAFNKIYRLLIANALQNVKNIIK
jgi:hypothetical protein